MVQISLPGVGRRKNIRDSQLENSNSPYYKTPYFLSKINQFAKKQTYILLQAYFVANKYKNIEFFLVIFINWSKNRYSLDPTFLK